MGQYCFARWRLSFVVIVYCRLLLSIVVVVCNAAGGRAGQPPGAWAVGRPTLHDGPVRLRPIKATLCYCLVRWFPYLVVASFFPCLRHFSSLHLKVHYEKTQLVGQTQHLRIARRFLYHVTVTQLWVNYDRGK